VKTPVLAEKKVAEQVKDLLAAHGYKVIRLQVGSFSRRGAWLSIGERGMPDLLALKPNGCIFVETKRSKGGVLSDDQMKWHTLARIQGCNVCVVATDDDLNHLKQQMRATA